MGIPYSTTTFINNPITIVLTASTGIKEVVWKKMETYEKPTWKTKFRSWLNECWRVLRVTKKPGTVEFQTIVKVSGLGIVVIGLIGFVISMLKQLLF